MFTIMLKILKLVHAPKSQKSQYLENKTFLKEKSFFIIRWDSNMVKSSFLAEVIIKLSRMIQLLLYSILFEIVKELGIL